MYAYFERLVLQSDGISQTVLPFQIYSKVWDEGVQQTLAKRALEAKKMWEAEHDGRLEMQRENGQLARNQTEVEA